jgi:hemerythrin-like metal-binding protein
MSDVHHLEWKKQYSVHVPKLDEDHRQIFELLNQLRDAVYRQSGDRLVPQALEKLNRYALVHLQREELMLRIWEYPAYAEHKAEHDAYLAKVASLKANLERRDISVRIVNFLSGWWRDHILTSDKRYARYFRNARHAPPS